MLIIEFFGMHAVSFENLLPACFWRQNDKIIIANPTLKGNCFYFLQELEIKFYPKTPVFRINRPKSRFFSLRQVI